MIPLSGATGTIDILTLDDASAVGTTVRLVFQATGNEQPPFTIRIAYGSDVVVERVLRELPTGKPQSAPPVEFVPTSSGECTVEIHELYGKGAGRAVIQIR